MSRPTHFRLRWKGAVTGPFPLPRVQEMLRAGEISLLHNIEVDGAWTTVRDYFRAIGLTRGPVVAEPSPTRAEAVPGEAPRADDAPADVSRLAAGEALERSVREGYLWCGSTFLLPPLFALLIYVLNLLAPGALNKVMLMILLACTTAPAALIPILFVRKIGATLEQEGLSEIRQTQSNLAVLLGTLSLCLWMLCFYVLIPGHS